MPAPFAALRFPCERVLLPRTRLAYVHLPRLLSDAKRDRSARISGYVAVWLPEELLILYLHAGELVNATRLSGRRVEAVAISEALAEIPAEPEYGEICFHQAAAEQLACMYQSHATLPEPWPGELDVCRPSSLFPHLMATTFDGALELIDSGSVNYLVFRDGAVQRAYLSDSQDGGSLVERVQRLFSTDRRASLSVRRWPVPPELPRQASPALLAAYREMMAELIRSMIAAGRDSAPAIAEHARTKLLEAHPVLAGFSVTGRPVRDPVAGSHEVTAAIAAWTTEVIWAGMDHGVDDSAEALVRNATRERRHMLQSAGFYELLPWKIAW
jgi:hypothetical protein